MKLTYSLGVMILIGILGYTFWNNTKQVDQVVTPDMGANTALAKVILPETFSESAKVGKLFMKLNVLPVMQSMQVARMV